MMGRESSPQASLFYTGINLDKRVRSDHALRKVARMVDFDFVYTEVKESYGYNGNVSVPPPMILKLMLLLVLYNVRSERELMATLPERLDWLWFLGLELDSEIPDHSVLSKARKRWGVDLFRGFFERIVWQCVESGLVDGKKLFCDSSLVEADASCNSVVDTQGLKRYLNPAYRELEARLEEREEKEKKDDDSQGTTPRQNVVNQRYTSTTDPDASVVRKGQGKAKLHYQTHRGIDGAYGVITATLIGPGDENEAHRLGDLIEAHHDNSRRNAEVVVADSKYGTTANFLECYDRGILAHIPVLKQTQDQQERRRKIFPESLFAYDPQTDTYTCPAGQTLRRRKHWVERKAFEYVTARGVCQQCPLRIQCTRSQSAAGRTLKRHERQEVLENLRAQAQSRSSKRDIQIRQHFMERSFAEGKRFGLKRARWRGGLKVQIQDYLIAAAQNIALLIAHARPKPRVVLTAGIHSVTGFDFLDTAALQHSAFAL